MAHSSWLPDRTRSVPGSTDYAFPGITKVCDYLIYTATLHIVNPAVDGFVITIVLKKVSRLSPDYMHMAM